MTDNRIRQGLREFTAEELAHIQPVTTSFPNLNRQVLAKTLREHLQWYSPSGALKRNSYTGESSNEQTEPPPEP